MKTENAINYGPLNHFIGRWIGHKGKDLSPEPDGTEVNLYTETMLCTEAFELDNAQQQVLSAVHYQLKVLRISDDKVIHQETGFWLWEQGTKNIIHSFTIPRGMNVLAGGEFEVNDDNDIVFNVSATIDKSDWQITQSPFLYKKAKTKKFEQQVVLNENTLRYTQTTMLDIYGREFTHTDQNILIKVY
ncbi:MAG: FABP family protein [Psychromonas sp.]|nr:FABP family protein [Psychromonas sp.]